MRKTRPSRGATARLGRAMVAAAVLAVAGARAAPALAQQMDPAGTWTCSANEYGSGEVGEPDLFNIALYRSGQWASSGRRPDGGTYTGEGTWRFGRKAGTDGFEVTIRGRVRPAGGDGSAIPTPVEYILDVVSQTEMSRLTRIYRTTRSVECVRQG